MTHPLTHQLVMLMIAVERQSDDPFAVEFAASINRQAMSGDWCPTDKQLEVMRRVVTQHFLNDDDDDFQVIER